MNIQKKAIARGFKRGIHIFLAGVLIVSCTQKRRTNISPEELERQRIHATNVSKMEIFSFNYLDDSTLETKPHATDVFEYNKDGNVVRQEHSVRRPDQMNLEPELIRITQNEFDSTGLLLRALYSYPSRSQDSTWIKYDYDSLRQLSSQTFVSLFPRQHVWSIYRYEYDEIGRVIRETEYGTTFNPELNFNDTTLSIKRLVTYNYDGSSNLRIRHHIVPQFGPDTEMVFHAVSDGYVEGYEHTPRRYDGNGFLIEYKDRAPDYSGPTVRRSYRFNASGNPVECIETSPDVKIRQLMKFQYEYFH